MCQFVLKVSASILMKFGTIYINKYINYIIRKCWKIEIQKFFSKPPCFTNSILAYLLDLEFNQTPPSLSRTTMFRIASVVFNRLDQGHLVIKLNYTNRVIPKRIFLFLGYPSYKELLSHFSDQRLLFSTYLNINVLSHLF